MGKHAFRGHIGLFLLVLMLAWGGVAGVSAAPQALPAVATATYAPSQIQKFGIESNIGTRFGRLGQMQQPMDLAQRTNAGIILEQMKWEFVEQPVCGQYRWDFYDELVTQARAHGLEIMAQSGTTISRCQLGKRIGACRTSAAGRTSSPRWSPVIRATSTNGRSGTSRTTRSSGRARRSSMSPWSN